MAIIIKNKSKCPICNRVLTNQEEYILTPPLISNTKDSLFIFSDTGLHRSCLDKIQFKEKLLKHILIYHKKPLLSNLKCNVDNLAISNPQKIILIGLITTDENEELYKFNYTILNKDNVSKWKYQTSFIKAGENFLEENKWASLADFNYLEYVLNEVKRNC